MKDQRIRSGIDAAQRVSCGLVVALFARLLVVAGAAVVALPGLVQAALVIDTPTGIHAVIHTPAEVAAQVRSEGGRAVLSPAGSPPVEIDAALYPWAGLTPLPADEVMAALMAMNGFATDATVDVYILPGFPSSTWSSFAQGRAIFLAPTLAPVAASTAHYLVTHEMGHVLTTVAVDPRSARWDGYLALRGLTADSLSPDATHAEQAREILAEDLRHLFGGPLATLSGTIENSRLALPEVVPGLRDALIAWLADPGAATPAASRAMPNPCNPRTVVELELPDSRDGNGAAAQLDIYDVRGHLVRRISGGEVAGGVVRVAWDGADAAGRAVASGTYLYELRLGGSAGRGHLSVVR